MFTDMVGYSALVQRNEKLALALLDEHRQILREQFPTFNGREVETTGDGFLVEFGSALEAARCAIEIQRALATRNLAVPPERQVQLRIGIHVGDVIHRDGHVLGDGVNIAARLQPLAEPGGICISIDVARQVQHNLEARVTPLGEKQLKNIRLPLEICRIVLPWEGGRGQESKQPHWSGAVGVWVGLGLIAAVLAFTGIWLDIHWPSQKSDSKPLGVGAKPMTSLAVLPLENLSRDPAQETFVAGITELLCTELSGLSALKKVTSRTTIMQYKGTRKAIPQIASELGVDGLLEGSAQREGDTVVVSVQLIEGATDRHIWATNYQREVKSLLKLETDLARAVAEEVQARLTPEEHRRLANARSVDPQVLQLYFHARSLWSRREEADLKRATEFAFV